MLRWWDGDAWTDHVQPRPEALAPAREPEPRPESVFAPVAGAAHDATPGVSGAGVLRDVTAPWDADLKPAAPDVLEEHRRARAHGNGNGSGHGLATLETERAPFDPPPFPDDDADAPAAPGEGASRFRRVLIAGIVIVALAIGGGVAYKQGAFDSLIGGGTREASSASVAVFTGNQAQPENGTDTPLVQDFSFEAPKTWQRQTNDLGAYFHWSIPDSSYALVDASDLGPGLDTTNLSVRDFVLADMRKAVPLDVKGLEVRSEEPFELDGVTGEQVVLGGVGTDGQITEVVETVLIRGQHAYTIVLSRKGPAIGDASLREQYDAVIQSLQFED